MTRTNSGEHAEQKVPLRDWTLLPLLGLATMGMIAVGVGSLAGWMFSISPGMGKCVQLTDSNVGIHGKPNAVCWDKGRETALIEYRLNNCGYRMDIECGPPAPGTYRIVMMGSSVALAQGVPHEKSLAALLPAELSPLTGLKIEVYNEAMWWEYPQVAALRFNEVLAAKPNLVLWILTPAEVGYLTIDPALLKPGPPTARAGMAARVWRQLKGAVATVRMAANPGEAWHNLQAAFVGSSTGVMLLHIMYQSQARYVDSYLRGPDSNAGFLRAELSLAWANDLHLFDKAAAKIEARAKAAGVPLAVVLVPNRAEAAMISMGQWPAGFDPYKLGTELRPIVERHGGAYIDILPDFRALPNPERYYLPVDGHPDADGNALLSRLLAKDLSSGKLPALNAAFSAQPGSGQGR